MLSQCSACRAKFQAPDDSSGRTTECPHCGKSTVIRRVAEKAPPIASSALESVYQSSGSLHTIWIATNVISYIAAPTVLFFTTSPVVAALVLIVTLPVFLLAMVAAKLSEGLILLFCEIARDVSIIARSSIQFSQTGKRE